VDERPITRYAKAPDGVSLAYQITGEGPLDLVWLPSLTIPIDLLWEEPGFVRFAKRLSGFSRCIWLESRGTGASSGSDLDAHAKREADLGAVLDATGCEKGALVAFWNSGPTAIRFAAHHPDRVQALVLINSYAYYLQEPDCPWGFPRHLLEPLGTAMGQAWETGSSLEYVAPSRLHDEAFRAWYSRSEHLGIGPDHMGSLIFASFSQDARETSSSVAVPSLVLHRAGDRHIRVGAGRYLAEHIPAAKYVELPGDDHLFFVGDTDALLDEIEEFLTGGHQAPEGDVVTTTILFTDIVSSTEQSARMGHRKWTTLTDDHNAMVRATLRRHQGREIKTIGDGFLATFDATTRAVRAGTEIVAAAKGMGLEVRAGVHIGEVEVRPDDVVGLPVSIAKRICDLAGPGQVFVSEAVKGLLVGSGIALSEQGTHVMKGVPDEWRLFVVAR
jgi:class 3 adenylate cyclase